MDLSKNGHSVLRQIVSFETSSNNFANSAKVWQLQLVTLAIEFVQQLQMKTLDNNFGDCIKRLRTVTLTKNLATLAENSQVYDF